MTRSRQMDPLMPYLDRILRRLSRPQQSWHPNMNMVMQHTDSQVLPVPAAIERLLTHRGQKYHHASTAQSEQQKSRCELYLPDPVYVQHSLGMAFRQSRHSEYDCDGERGGCSLQVGHGSEREWVELLRSIEEHGAFCGKITS